MSRRAVLAGIGTLATLQRATAQTKSPIAHGILANNPLAQDFEEAPSQLPDIILAGADGLHTTAEFKGRTILMPLWAEWCQPCLGELSDFGKLQAKFGGPNFAVMPVLTDTKKSMTPTIIAQLFGLLRASQLTPWMERDRGSQLMLAMARRGVEVAIPCNLLIAPDGHVVARQFGLKWGAGRGSTPNSADGKPPTLAERAQSGETLSLWGEDAGAEFATAMSNGFLSQA